MRTTVGKWLIEATEDNDGHLTIALSHSDGTEVVCCDVDIAISDEEWSDRFTTEGIEVLFLEKESGKN